MELATHNDLPVSLVASWLDGCPSANTRKAYEFDYLELRTFIGADLLSLPAAEQQAAILRYIEDLAKRGKSPATTQRKLASIKSLYSHLCELDPRLPNIGRMIKTGRVRDLYNVRELKSRRHVKYLPREDLRQMFYFEDEPVRLVALKFLYYAALRVSELATLRWGDLVQSDDGWSCQVYGKTGERFVPVPSSVVEEAIDLLGKGKADDLIIGVVPRTIGRWVERAAGRLGHKGVSPHWLRHSRANHLLNNGAGSLSIIELRDFLGHGSVETTNLYLHSTLSEDRQVTREEI